MSYWRRAGFTMRARPVVPMPSLAPPARAWAEPPFVLIFFCYYFSGFSIVFNPIKRDLRGLISWGLLQPQVLQRDIKGSPRSLFSAHWKQTTIFVLLYSLPLLNFFPPLLEFSLFLQLFWATTFCLSRDMFFHSKVSAGDSGGSFTVTG